jgi:hypothetical protein
MAYFGDMNRNLTAAEVAALKKRGRYRVSVNLYLQISEWRTRAWLFCYTRDGRARQMGLGSAKVITLTRVRKLAEECHAQLQRGIDPLDARNDSRRKARAKH